MLGEWLPQPVLSQSSTTDTAIAIVEVTGGLAPRLWWFELRNILLVCERKGRISAADTMPLLNEITQLRITLGTDGDQILRLARKHRLTVYDAAYLDLALRRSASLGTLDTQLATAARAEGITVIE